MILNLEDYKIMRLKLNDHKSKKGNESYYGYDIPLNICTHMDILNFKKELEYVLIDNKDLIIKLILFGEELFNTITYKFDDLMVVNTLEIAKLHIVYALYDNLVFANSIFLSFSQIMNSIKSDINDYIQSYIEDNEDYTDVFDFCIEGSDSYDAFMESLSFIDDLYKRRDYTLNNTCIIDKPDINEAVNIINDIYNDVVWRGER